VPGLGDEADALQRREHLRARLRQRQRGVSWAKVRAIGSPTCRTETDSEVTASTSVKDAVLGGDQSLIASVDVGDENVTVTTTS
jgi:hypothetical protein